MKYQKWHIGTAAEGDTALLREAGYPGLLATVLASRGITTAEAAAEALEREGAVWKDSAAQCAAGCGVVITIVGYPQDVDEVYFGPG